jgi:hypothetical protein
MKIYGFLIKNHLLMLMTHFDVYKIVEIHHQLFFS